jgi:hypothetical protein
MLRSKNSPVLPGLRTVSDAPAIRFRRARTAILALLLACTAFWAGPTLAVTLSCEPSDLGKVLDGGVISIPMGAAPGPTVAVLAPNPFQSDCFFPTGSSPSGTIITTLETTIAPAQGFDDVYPTSVAGLGVRYTLNAPTGCSTVNVTIKNQSLVIPCAITGVPGGPHVFVNMTVTPSFVVTDTVKSGASALASAPTIKFTYTIKDAGGHGPNRRSVQVLQAARLAPRRVQCKLPASRFRCPTPPRARFQAERGRRRAVKHST